MYVVISILKILVLASINCNLLTVVKLNAMQACRTIRVHKISIGLLKNPKSSDFLFDRLCGLVVYVHDDLHLIVITASHFY